MMSARTRESLAVAYRAFAAGDTDKWPFYATVEKLHAARRCTYADVARVAVDIDVAVIRDRVRYVRRLASS